MRMTRTRTMVVASAETALRRESVLCIAPQKQKMRLAAAARRDAGREDERREGGMKRPRRASTARTFRKLDPDIESG